MVSVHLYKPKGTTMTSATATIDITDSGEDSTPTQVDPQWALAVPAEDLAEFLADPIGYGQYEFADPLSLDEFSTCRHMHGLYIAPLTS
jgi:hypothetical protein